jgi:poly [ADP-ribose] polymerase
MFGKGVYLADISSKSAGYCCHYSSGGIGLLLLCEAELGKPMLELTNASYSAAEEAKKEGCYATWGKGRTGPQAWKDASCVNEKLKGVLIVSQPS